MIEPRKLTTLLIAQFSKERSIREVIDELQGIYPDYSRGELRKHVHHLKAAGLLDMPRDEIYKTTKTGAKLLE